MNRQQAVRQTLLECANQPFEYGVLDCCLFPAVAAQKFTGVDYAALFNHRSEADALAYIEEHGGLTGLVTDTLRSEPVDVSCLECCDPVIVDVPIFGETLGIFMGQGRGAMIKTDVGVVEIVAQRIVRGWKLAGSS